MRNIVLFVMMLMFIPSIVYAVPRQLTVTWTYRTSGLPDITKFGMFYSDKEGEYGTEPQNTIPIEDVEVVDDFSHDTILRVTVPVDVEYETDYWFVLNASDDSTSSIHSSFFKFTVPEAEIIVETVLCRERIPLKWSMLNTEGIGGYQVHYKLIGDPNAVWVVIDVGNTDHYILGNDVPLKIGREYGISVTAYDTVGNYSDYSEIQACLIGKPPIPILTILDEVPENWL